MTTAAHGLLTTAEGIHVCYQFVYANAAARAAATGFVASQVGKLARQLDDNSLWMLTATTPTWVQISNGTGGITTFRYFLDPSETNPLHATYGDDFNAATLNAIWTRRNLVDADDTHQYSDGSHMLVHCSNSAVDKMYLQNYTPSGDFEIQMAFTRLSANPGTTFGLLMLDTNGDGVGLFTYNNDTLYLSLLVAYQHNSNPNSQTGIVTPSLRRTWLRLRKVGTTYSGYISYDGIHWSQFTFTTTQTYTLNRVGFGRTFAAIDEYFSIDWFELVVG
jgi:hypothetical protein